ncbi:hypothetical protein GBA52_007290 [Prunus armeniaca]|nr:hypothetical protein GBA52_007290 [Prunus armeniaca]
MAVMEKLRMFVAQEPVVAASCLIAGFGLFLPAVVRPILDSFEASKQVPQPALSDVGIVRAVLHLIVRLVVYMECNGPFQPAPHLLK